MEAFDALIIMAYVSLIILVSAKGAFAPFCAMVVCAAFACSPLFDAANAIQVHLFYVITYLILIPAARSKRIGISMFIMVLLNAVMIWDAHNYAHIKTWYFNHYALNTALIHCCIVLSMYAGRRSLSGNDMLYVRLCSLLTAAIGVSRDRQLSSIDTSKSNKEKKV